MTRPVAMKCTLIALAAFWLGIADARIEAPDHVIYGTATVFGDPAASGQVIQVRRRASGELLAQYRLGASERLGDQYAVRIPMDTVEPRVDGFARPGDLINIFISGELAGKAAVGKAGHAVRLDIDPQSVGDGPSLEVVDAEVFEGNSGTVQATFEATMNTTSDNDVILSWNTTVDGSATGGGSCTGETDYLASDSSLTIPAGRMLADISITVCGDTVIEGTETFEIALFTTVPFWRATQRRRPSSATTTCRHYNSPMSSCPNPAPANPGRPCSGPCCRRIRISRPGLAIPSSR